LNIQWRIVVCIQRSDVLITGAAKIQLEAVLATSEAARLLEILPTASRVLGPSENPITGKNDSRLRI
jgi:hypothetical protein